MDPSGSRVIQITDTHICGNPESLVLGIPTRQALNLVVEDIRAHYPSSDLLLVTGDLSQDGSLDSYRYLRRVLEGVSARVRCIPGNHDDRDMMGHVLPADMVRMDEPVRLDDWRILLLDSVVTGAVHGAVSDDDLEKLESRLRDLDGRYALVTIHHPPIELGSRWMDGIRLRNGERLLALIERFAAVKILAWGHAHQDYAGRYAGIGIYGTPSTCFQFKPRSADFELDGLPPGYRVFDLAADGGFTTEVVRLSEFPYAPTLDARYNEP
ncbi:MAG: 3',5'-cyclic-AMP phosphodiesterase [Gammaproteobacteria bacterium]|nr:3',5'-cyclic-AMP phosphodiesterase [Gammaproteobacteria bacterium]